MLNQSRGRRIQLSWLHIASGPVTNERSTTSSRLLKIRFNRNTLQSFTPNLEMCSTLNNQSCSTLQTRNRSTVDNKLFPNPYELSNPVWWKDSRGFTFEYNQRGHQVYRVIEVGARHGVARAIISDEPKTFFSYRPANGGLADSGKRYRYDVNDGKEIIWMSERDGWSHLYLYDGLTGQVKNQITKGNWLVRGVQRVDVTTQQIWFSAGGMYERQGSLFCLLLSN